MSIPDNPDARRQAPQGAKLKHQARGGRSSRDGRVTCAHWSSSTGQPARTTGTRTGVAVGAGMAKAWAAQWPVQTIVKKFCLGASCLEGRSAIFNACAVAGAEPSSTASCAVEPETIAAKLMNSASTQASATRVHNFGEVDRRRKVGRRACRRTTRGASLAKRRGAGASAQKASQRIAVPIITASILSRRLKGNAL